MCIVLLFKMSRNQCRGCGSSLKCNQRDTYYIVAIHQAKYELIMPTLKGVETNNVFNKVIEQGKCLHCNYVNALEYAYGISVSKYSIYVRLMTINNIKVLYADIENYPETCNCDWVYRSDKQTVKNNADSTQIEINATSSSHAIFSYFL